MNRGVNEFDSGRIEEALEHFREVQTVDSLHTMAYCWAARCLKSRGERQEAIRELRKILMKRPEDRVAQEEMRKLLST
jgi:tetratricopeptide (TPR) repeat protein